MNCSTSLRASTRIVGIYGGSFLFGAMTNIAILNYVSVNSNFGKDFPPFERSFFKFSSIGANNFLFFSKFPGSNETLNLAKIYDSRSSIRSYYAFYDL
jgi:hypothetical protein